MIFSPRPGMLCWAHLSQKVNRLTDLLHSGLTDVYSDDFYGDMSWVRETGEDGLSICRSSVFRYRTDPKPSERRNLILVGMYLQIPRDYGVQYWTYIHTYLQCIRSIVWGPPFELLSCNLASRPAIVVRRSLISRANFLLSVSQTD